MLMLLGATAAAFDMLDGRRPGVTVDGVMGGRSDADGSVSGDDGTISFSGTVNTNGGGFAYMTLIGDSMDLSSEAGILLEFNTMDFETYGAAPIAFAIELSGSERCSLVAAFAVPTTAAVERAQAWVPLSQFARKGQHWDYSSSRTGVPSQCTASSTTSVDQIGAWTAGVYYQAGAFDLELHAASARATSPSISAPASLPAPSLLSSTAAKAESLLSKAGSGVGMAQMSAMAAAALEVAALQSSDADLMAVANLTATSSWSSAARAQLLQEAFTAHLSGETVNTSPSASGMSAGGGGGGGDDADADRAAAAGSPGVIVGVLCGVAAVIAAASLAWYVRRSHGGPTGQGRLMPEAAAGKATVGGPRAPKAPQGGGGGGGGRGGGGDLEVAAAVATTPSSMDVMVGVGNYVQPRVV